MQLVDFAMCEAYVFMLSMKKTIVRALTRIAILEGEGHKPLGLEAEAGGLYNPLDRWQAVHATCMDIDATDLHMPYVQSTLPYTAISGTTPIRSWQSPPGHSFRRQLINERGYLMS